MEALKSHISFVNQLQYLLNNPSPPDKMAAILQPTQSNAFWWMKTFFALIRISRKFAPKGPIDNKPAMAQLMAWGRTGDKPLTEPLLTQFTDAYMRH